MSNNFLIEAKSTKVTVTWKWKS